ncbi:antibiotic resistance protein VanZ [Halobacteriales archaeon QS_1_68_20]|nr:MAG: antibiotic resistance protein VanZ [Halobacteriales archaeon QS_1_68_20]
MRVPLLPWPVRAAAAVAVAAAIFAVSVTRPPEAAAVLGPLGLVGMDKWVHAVAYGGLAVTVAYAVPARSRTRLVIAVGAAVGFGLVVESVQYGLPFRSFDLVDATANATGAVLAAAVWRLLSVGRRLEPVEDVDD